MKITEIRLLGEAFFLFGTMKSGGPIATMEQYKAGKCSHAHLFKNGLVQRFGAVIAKRDDIKVIGQRELGKIAPSLSGMLTSDTWPDTGSVRLERMRLMRAFVQARLGDEAEL